MIKEIKSKEQPEITCANTAKILLGEAIIDLSCEGNQPHNIFNGAFRAVCFWGRNSIETQSLILDTLKKVHILDFNTPDARVTELFDPCSDTFDSDERSELCFSRLLETLRLLIKIGIPNEIIIESLLQSCVDYGTTISADSRILMSLIINALYYSFKY
jgi:hypothetical protein